MGDTRDACSASSPPAGPRFVGRRRTSERLEITQRTVRRDVDRLRELGYPSRPSPVATAGTAWPGGRLPPLLLNDEEAVAVAIGLRCAVDGTVAGLEESAISTLAKLDHLLPAT